MTTEDGIQSAPGALRAQAMFWVALFFLALLSLVLPHGDPAPGQETGASNTVWGALALLWGVIATEGVVGVLASSRRDRAALLRLLLVLVLPPFRMMISPARRNRAVWLPVLGWIETGKLSLEDMAYRTALPMLVSTALIVPVIATELFFGDAMAQSSSLRTAIWALTAFIWFTFALEFIVMVSLAPKKLDFCKQHWINIVIILLPLLAFLRSLQLFRFLRLAKAGKMMRVYRLRGLATRASRLALAFNLLERWRARDPAKYARHLAETIVEREAELEAMRARLVELHKEIGTSENRDGA